MPVGRSQVLKATFTSESPELASEILNVLVGFYLANQMENRVAVPTKVGDFLKGELDKLQAKVRKSTKRSSATGTRRCSSKASFRAARPSCTRRS